MNPQLVIRLVIAAAIFGSAWTIQDWRYGAKEADRDRQTHENTLESERLARRAESGNSTRTIKALNAANKRADALRANAAGSRDALVRLSDAADEALRTAGRSLDACLDAATTSSQLLVAVSTERRELAEAADRHVSDIQTLTDAWPKCRAPENSEARK